MNISKDVSYNTVIYKSCSIKNTKYNTYLVNVQGTELIYSQIEHFNWILIPITGVPNAYNIMSIQTSNFLSGKANECVLNTYAANDQSQQWLFNKISIQQFSFNNTLNGYNIQ